MDEKDQAAVFGKKKIPKFKLNFPKIPKLKLPKFSGQSKFDLLRNKKAVRLCLIVILLLAVAGFLFYGINTGLIGFAKKITIEDTNTKDKIYEYKKPAAWLNEPYFFGQTGAQLVIFPSKKDKAAGEGYKNKAVSNWYDRDGRAITAYIFSTSTSDKKKEINFFDGRIKASTGFENFIIESKAIDGGEYRCGQSKHDDKYQINCFVAYENHASTLYTLLTEKKHLNRDLKSFYKVIESAKVLK